MSASSALRLVVSVQQCLQLRDPTAHALLTERPAIDEEGESDEFRDSLADRRHAFGESARQVRLV